MLADKYLEESEVVAVQQLKVDDAVFDNKEATKLGDKENIKKTEARIEKQTAK